jgi:hypothetical protein
MTRTGFWLAAVGVLLFLIGWQASRLMARDAAIPTDLEVSSSRSRGGFDRSSRHFGPLFGSERDFARDLDLDDEQQKRIADVLAAAERALDDLERASREIKGAARRDVLAILTAEQRDALATAFEESFVRRVAERVAADLEWLARAGASAAEIEGARPVLEAYERGKREFLRPPCDDAARADDGDVSVAIAAARRERDAGLAAVLSAPLAERFKSERTSHRRGGPKRSDGPVPTISVEPPPPRKDSER